MNKAWRHFCLIGVLAGLFTGASWADEPPIFSLLVTKVYDADFNQKACPECPAAVLNLGTAAPGDTVQIEAFAFDWDDIPNNGLCDGGDNCRIGGVPCTSMHCSDTGTPCTSSSNCNVGASCVVDTCHPEPAIGAFNWSIDCASLLNDGPGGLSLTVPPCDSFACAECEADPIGEGGPGGLCDDCFCFHGIDFACIIGFCTCCNPSEAPACQFDSGLGMDVCRREAVQFISARDPKFILANRTTVLATGGTCPGVGLEWLGAITSGSGTAQGTVPSYMGSGLFTIAECSGGTFTVRMIDDPDKSFLNDGNARKLPNPRHESLVINLPPATPVCGPGSCDDSDLCTVDSCDDSTCVAVCLNDPVVCPEGESCDPADGVCKPAGNNCTALVSSSPANCIIDARQPFNIDGTNPSGFNQIVLTFSPPDCDAALLAAGGYLIEEVPAGAVPGFGVVPLDNTATLNLAAPIEQKKWTCFSHAATTGEVCLGYLPGDVNNDRTANPAIDLGALIDCINNPGTCPTFRTNIDRLGTDPGALDITRLIDLFNGAGSFDSATGSSLQACPSAP